MCLFLSGVFYFIPCPQGLSILQPLSEFPLRLFNIAPWTARRSNQSILKEISPEYSLEGLMLQLKLQYFGYLMQKADLLESQRIKLNLVTEQQQEINSAFFLFSGLSFHFVDGFLCFAKAFKFN